MDADVPRLHALFDEVIALPPAQRAARVAALCAGQPDLRKLLERLITAADEDDDFLAGRQSGAGMGANSRADSRADSSASGAAALAEGPGSRIGPYKLLQQVGEGGFGVVFMAEQERPVVRRVALKIIKLGMDTRAVVARFEAERQALAMMDHPNIARVLDAGSTDTGRPYFVMELVRGDPITEYCDTHHVSTPERLALFTQVCHAVQHAHQKGIIHRDIKPSNVLVTVADGKPIPKVIDFGIAKATTARLTEKTLFTAHRSLIGTPVYMSPEQAEMSGVDIDTRSDIYSLGVLLYELLTGTTPFDPQTLRDAGYGEMQRIIREVDPPKPSTRLSTLEGTGTASRVALHRHTEPAQLGALLRGDLDWIVMKAMEKDRTRRYETANGLALDVMRHLEGEAVLAVPPSVQYRLRKFARRHRAAIGAASVMLLLLVGGVAVSAWQAVRASRSEEQAIASRNEEARHRQLAEEQRDRAVRAEAEAQEARNQAHLEAATAKAVGDFLKEDLLGQVGSDNQIDKGFAPDPQLTIRTALHRAASRIDDKFKDQPLVEATIRMTVGEGFQFLGAEELALPQFERAYALRAAGLGPDHVDTLATLNMEGVALGNMADPRSLEIFEEVLERRRSVLGPEHKDTLMSMSNLAVALGHEERFDEAWALCTEGLAIAEEQLGRDSESALHLLGVQAWIRYRQQDFATSLELHERQLELLTKARGPDHPYTIHAAINTAVIRNWNGDRADSERLLTETLETAKRVLGPDHPDTLWAVEKLAEQYSDYAPQQGRELLEEFLPTARSILGPRHPSTLHLMSMLAGIERFGFAQHTKARDLLDEVYRARLEALGPDTDATREAQAELAGACGDNGDVERAAALYEDLIAYHAAKHGEEHEAPLSARVGLADAYLTGGQAARALPIAEDALGRLRALTGGASEATLHAVETLRDVYLALDRVEEALPLAEEFEAGITERHGADCLAAAFAAGVVVDALRRRERFDEALAKVDATLDGYRRRLGEEHEVTLRFTRTAVGAYLAAGREAEAVALAEDNVARTTAQYGPTSDETMMASLGLALAYIQTERTDDYGRVIDAVTAVLRAQPERSDYVHLMLRASQTNETAGRYLEAAAMMEEIVTKETARLGSEHPKVMELKAGLAARCQSAGQHNRAASLYAALLEYERRNEPADAAKLAGTLAALATSLVELKQTTQAEPHIAEVLALCEAGLPGVNAEAPRNLDNLAAELRNLGRPTEAERVYRASIALIERQVQGDHPHIVMQLADLSTVLQEQGRLDEAEVPIRRALEMAQRLRDGDHVVVASGLFSLGNLLHDMGRLAEAEPYLSESLAMRERLFPGDHIDRAQSLNNLGLLKLDQGRLDEAEPLLVASLEMHQRLLPSDDLGVAAGLGNLGALFDAQGRSAEAEANFRASLAIHERLELGDNADMAKILAHLGALLSERSRLDEAEPLLRRALEMRRRLSPDDRYDTATSLGNLAICLLARGPDAEAETLLGESLEMLQRLDGRPRSSSLALLGLKLTQTGTASAARRAEPLLRECLELRRVELPDGHESQWLKYNAMSLLGGALLGQAADASLARETRIAKLDEAESLLLEGYSRMKDDPRVLPPAQNGGADRKLEALERIVKLYELRHELEPTAGHAATARTWKDLAD